jgi:hypothetical protein
LSDNEIKNNVIANSRVHWPVEEIDTWTDPRGSDTVHDNCLRPSNPDDYSNQNGVIMPNG